MELDTVDKIKRAFFRLTDTESDDPELDLLGEGTDEVVLLALTRGYRSAQRWMLGRCSGLCCEAADSQPSTSA